MDQAISPLDAGKDSMLSLIPFLILSPLQTLRFLPTNNPYRNRKESKVKHYNLGWIIIRDDF